MQLGAMVLYRPLSPHHTLTVRFSIGGRCSIGMKNRSAISLLLAANAISGFAQGVSLISIPWYFVRIMDMEDVYGALFTAITLSTLAWSLYAGTLIDRFSRKAIFQWINVAGLIGIGTVTGLTMVSPDLLPLWVGIAFGITIFIFNIHFPSIYAFMQEVVPREHYTKYNSIMEVLHQSVSASAGILTALVLPDPLGGSSFRDWLPFHLEPWTMTQVFALDAATYLAAFVLVSAIRYTPLIRRAEQKESIWLRFRNGLSFLKKNPLLFYFGMASYSLFMVVLVETFLLLSIYVDQHLGSGPTIYGLSKIGYSFGALFAGILTARLLGSWARVDSVLLLLFVITLALLSVGVTELPWWFIVFNYILGVCNAGVRILRNTYIFEHVPNDYIGRTNSIFNSMNILLRSGLIAIFSIGYFSTQGHVAEAYIWCAVFLTAFMVPTFFLRKRLRKLKIIEPQRVSTT